MAVLYPSAIAFISNAVAQKDQGKVMGVAQSLSSASFAISPLLGGAIAGVGYNAHILFGGGVILLFTLVMFLGYREQIFAPKI